MKRLLLLLLITLFASCSTTRQVQYSQGTLDSYIGMTHQQLVQRLGAPISDVSDGADGYILVFEGNKQLFNYSSDYASHSSTLPRAQFFMNSEGICYNVIATNTNPVTYTSVGGTIALVLLLLILL